MNQLAPTIVVIKVELSRFYLFYYIGTVTLIAVNKLSGRLRRSLGSEAAHYEVDLKTRRVLVVAFPKHT